MNGGGSKTRLPTMKMTRRGRTGRSKVDDRPKNVYIANDMYEHTYVYIYVYIYECGHGLMGKKLMTILKFLIQ